MENEILEVEVVLDSGEKQSMRIQECDDWNSIEEGTRAIIFLLNNQKFIVEIISACEDDGVSFRIVGGKRGYHYDGNVVGSIYVEVKK